MSRLKVDLVSGPVEFEIDVPMSLSAALALGRIPHRTPPAICEGAVRSAQIRAVSRALNAQHGGVVLIVLTDLEEAFKGAGFPLTWKGDSDAS